VVVLVELAAGLSRVDRLASVAIDHKLERSTRRNVGREGPLGRHDGRRQGELAVFLEVGFAQIEPQGVEVEQHLRRRVVAAIHGACDLRVGVDPGQELLIRALENS